MPQQAKPLPRNNPPYSLPRVSYNTTREIQPQKKDPFAELFANPTVRGTASRSPDSQSGKIMRAAEENRNVRMVKEAENIRTAAQKTGTQTPKK